MQEAQTTDEMKWEMDEFGSFTWAKAEILGVDFRIHLIDQTPIPFIRNRSESMGTVERAMERVRSLGATDIGLGSLVASVAHGGIDLLPVAEKLGLRLDHGDDMSTNFAVEAVHHLAGLGLELASVTVGVVGAVGVMGAGFVKLISSQVKKFVFVVTGIDERVKRLQNQQIAEAASRGQKLEIAVETQFRALAEHRCQLVYVAHSAPTARLRLEHLWPGAIVLDACIPPAVFQSDLSGGRLLVLPVGCGILPRRLAPAGVGVNLGLGEASTGPVVYGCMLGCILGARRGEMRHRVESVDPAYARFLAEEARREEIIHQPFPMGEEEIQQFIAR